MLTANETMQVLTNAMEYCERHGVRRPGAQRQVYNEMLFMLVLRKRGLTDSEITVLTKLDRAETERILQDFPLIL